MAWFSVWLTDYQPEPFIVKAGNQEEAAEKTLDWAKTKYPGMFEVDPMTGSYMVKGDFTILVATMGAFH